MGGYSGFSGRWSFNPYFGMFTYVPCNGMYRDPYGYSYYSPYTVQRVYYSYNPPASVGGASSISNPRPASSTWSGPSYNTNLGYNTYNSRGDMNSYSGASSGVSSSPASSVSSGAGSVGGGEAAPGREEAVGEDPGEADQGAPKLVRVSHAVCARWVASKET